MKREQGFTLLELLMVVIIIAILAAIAFPSYIKGTEKTRAAEALQLLGAIRSAEARYQAQSTTNSYTNVPADLDIIDPANPVVTRSWGTVPVGLTLTVTSSSLARATGQYATQVLGMRHDTGALCGSFAVSVLDPAAPAACP